jgi:SagB-type dehydrogenase family enzyme
MKKKSIAVITLLFFIACSVFAEDAKPIKLPPPKMEGGKALMNTLKERRSLRTFSSRPLPPQTLSDLLWAASGINRPDIGKRTSPSAVNWQEIDIYLAMADGLYLYKGKDNALQPVLSRDIRSLTGKQPFVGEAPLNLIYVADYARMGGSYPEDRVLYSAADTGFISQNVYLFCASEGLATVVRGLVDREALAAAMKLKKSQHITLTQTVGYPK